MLVLFEGSFTGYVSARNSTGAAEADCAPAAARLSASTTSPHRAEILKLFTSILPNRSDGQGRFRRSAPRRPSAHAGQPPTAARIGKSNRVRGDGLGASSGVRARSHRNLSITGTR